MIPEFVTTWPVPPALPPTTADVYAALVTISTQLFEQRQMLTPLVNKLNLLVTERLAELTVKMKPDPPPCQPRPIVADLNQTNDLLTGMNVSLDKLISGLVPQRLQ